MTEKENNDIEAKASYKLEDVLKVADDVLNLYREKKYNFGAFIHGLIFLDEYLQFNYNIPQQQIADIRRGCRRYIEELEKIKK